MTEPTIEQAIEFLQSKIDIYGWHSQAKAATLLALRALEEMRDKKDYCHHGPMSPTFPGKVVYEDHLCLELPFPKPRTWRDVTAGEMAQRFPSTAEAFKACAKECLEKKARSPIGHEWR